MLSKFGILFVLLWNCVNPVKGVWYDLLRYITDCQRNDQKLPEIELFPTIDSKFKSESNIFKNCSNDVKTSYKNPYFGQNIWNDPVALFGLLLCAVLIYFIFVGTILDLVSNYGLKTTRSTKNSTTKDIFLSFSIPRNVKICFTADKSSNSLQELHGIRAISTLWILILHSNLVVAPVIENVLEILKQDLPVWVEVVNKGYLAVDSFFVLSGLLVAYNFLSQVQKEGSNFSWRDFFLHRYLRLTLTYTVVLLIARASIFPYLGSGYFTYFAMEEAYRCRQYGIWNLLYINNFVSLDQYCVTLSWSLAADMQFFVIAPIILIPLMTKRYRLAFKIGGLTIIACWAITYLIFVNNELKSYLISAKLNDLSSSETIMKIQYSTQVYMKPYCRIPPYLMGISVGWLLHVYKNQLIRFRNMTSLIFNIVLCLCMAAIVFSTLFMTDVSLRSEALFVSLVHSLWAFCLCGVIILCCTGNGGIFSKVLSSPFWHPLSKMSYGIYLIQLTIYEILFLSRRQPIRFNSIEMFIIVYSGLLLSLLGGFFVSIFVEYPLRNLQGSVALWKRETKKSK